MKGMQRYFALALLLSVVAGQAVAMEEQPVDAKNIVSQVAECAEQENSFVQAEEAFDSITRYEQCKNVVRNAYASFTPRVWGQKFGTAFSTKLGSAKEGLSSLVEQAKTAATAKKDALVAYPYKAAAQAALESVKDQAVAHKPLLIGAGLAVAYETGALNLAAKPFVYAANGVKSGAQKAYSSATNHKKVTGGIGATVATGFAGLGYYFKDGLVQAAQSGAQYVQPMVATVLENRSDIGKAAGAALVGVAAIESARAAYKMGKHYAARKAVLKRFEKKINNDCKAAYDRTAATSEFYQDSIWEKTLFTENELKAINDFKKNFNVLFNQARYLSDTKRNQALIELKDASTQFFMNFGI